VRRAIIGAALAVAALLPASPAAAQPAATAPPQPAATAPPGAVTATAAPRRDRALSIGLPALQGLGGLAGYYEQLLPGRRWSLVTGGAVRAGARGDFSSITLAAGAEARYWLRGSAIWCDAPPRSMVGWFAGGRVDLAWTHTRDDTDDRSLGNNLGVAVTGTFGYRFLIRNRVELTPMVGLGVTRETDLGGRLPGFTRGTARMGLTLGWFF